MMVRLHPLRSHFFSSSKQSRTTTDTPSRSMFAAITVHPHSTAQQPRAPADMSTPNRPPKREDDRQISRPDSWRPFNNRWMAHEQDRNQRPQPYERTSSLGYEGSRRRKRERALDPDAPTYRTYTTQGSLQDRRYVPASESVYARTASIPVSGAAAPPPWLLPNYSSQQYQQSQYHNQYQYQNPYQNQYQYAPFQYPPLAFPMTSPFTAINAYSTLATPHHPFFNGQRDPGTHPSRPESSNPDPRPQASPRRRSVTPPRAVPPTSTYLAQSSSPPTLTTATQPLLIILDLNGTLIHRIGRRPIRFRTRPGLHAFLKELFENYTVMVWTSSQPQTVREVLEKTFTAEEKEQFVAVWARDTLGLNARQYAEKVQVYKRLDKVWADKGIARLYPGFTESDDNNAATTPDSTTTTVITIPPGDSSVEKAKRKKKNKKQRAREATAAAAPSGNNTPWNQTNTLLIDDSALKALAQPYNIIEIPEFTSAHPPEHEEKVLDTVLRQLRVLAHYADVSCKVREWEELRRGLQRQRQERGGEVGVEADLPQSHSQADIEGFWDAQLARDEEAIRRMNGEGEGAGAGASGGDGVRAAKADADADAAETGISTPRRAECDSQAPQAHVQILQTHSQERTAGSKQQHEHRYSSSLSIETHTLSRSGNEGAKAAKNYIKRQKNTAPARHDVTTGTGAITFTGEGSRGGYEDVDSEADGGVVLRVH
ncbi:NIF domain-containing protein [Blastomyces dermatitidis ER-3]|uniref:NIF domain-containing protein n=1 Tax=Ajellomyces dermatitidis (strain ER-3 / ATCC MYA-2586) TaxID=559297 RepID=A0ABP2F144_AJEDR|nr:NIF domain-containing protein [Blastomyces dermatitidis ER-3]EEQ90143.2 NIF domain-containing protein [Blastomyces dermatitidis ER-3]